MANYIIRGSDAENVNVRLLSNGTAIDMSDPVQFPYDEVEVYLVDRYGREQVRYKTPSTVGFQPLDIVTGAAAGKVLFHILRADSINFTLGDLYAMPVLIDTSRAGFADGGRFVLDKIFLGEVRNNKI